MVKISVKTLFLSDTHVGSAGCHAKETLEALKMYNFENLYIIGDFFDFWVMKRKSLNWTADQTHLIQHILKRAKNGTKVYYIAGNHDDAIRNYNGFHFDNIHISDRVVYESVGGKKLLITHGDEFDPVVTVHPWLAKFASNLYDPLISLNRFVNRMRVARGRRPWSMSKYVKLRVKNVVSFVVSFEKTMIREANCMGLDGVICGHIHQPKISDDLGLLYINCGDAVENLTFVIEDYDGNFSIVNYYHLIYS